MGVIDPVLVAVAHPGRPALAGDLPALDVLGPGVRRALQRPAAVFGVPPGSRHHHARCGDFDVEAWRSEAVQRFGPEETYEDGSKQDYVQVAYSICDQSESERQQMIRNLADRYTGSLQEFIVGPFCPN